MADMIDQAQELDELFNAIAVANREAPAPLIHLSHCQWCGEPLPSRHGKFCNADCRADSDMWHRRHTFVGGFSNGA